MKHWRSKNAVVPDPLTSRPTVRTEFKAIDGGKTAVYMLRWVNTRGEKWPWSEICGATVAA